MTEQILKEHDLQQLSGSGLRIVLNTFAKEQMGPTVQFGPFEQSDHTNFDLNRNMTKCSHSQKICKFFFTSISAAFWNLHPNSQYEKKSNLSNLSGMKNSQNILQINIFLEIFHQIVSRFSSYKDFVCLCGHISAIYQ